MRFPAIATTYLPLAIYLIYLGLVNLSNRGRIFTGTLDFILLGSGISGLVVNGPMRILMPSSAVIRFGDNVWYPLLILYIFGTIWLLLLSRPRLVLYNLKMDEFFCIWHRTLEREQWATHSQGNLIQIDTLGIQFEIVPEVSLKNITLRATRSEQPVAGWQNLRLALQHQLLSHHPSHNWAGFVYVLCGLLLAMFGWTSMTYV